MLLVKPDGKTRPVDVWETGGTATHFHAPRYIRLVLQTKGDFSIIKLSDGRRMVIATDQRKRPFNELATEMLHKLSDQSEARIYGRAIIATLDEIGTAWRMVGRKWGMKHESGTS